MAYKGKALWEYTIDDRNGKREVYCFRCGHPMFQEGDIDSEYNNVTFRCGNPRCDVLNVIDSSALKFIDKPDVEDILNNIKLRMERQDIIYQWPSVLTTIKVLRNNNVYKYKGGDDELNKILDLLEEEIRKIKKE